MSDLFEVATEFKFDVGEAILNTKALTASVDQLSKTADSALASLSYLAGGLVAHLGLGSGGLLSVLTKAVQVSEAFNDSALMFSNNISTNFSLLTGDINTFNDRLETSKQIMSSITDEATKFGLDAHQLASITQLIATPLANRGKLGKNYQGASTMGRNLLLGSEAVGLHPQVAQESLYRALTEHMPLHGALFSRMLNTQAFKGAGIKTQGQLQVMNQDKKIDLLNKALEQLAGDADWLNNRLGSMNKQFVIMKNQIEAILKPIGDSITKPIRMILQGINGYLLAHGKDFGETIGKLIGSIFEDPRNLFYNVMQLKELKHDFKKAMEWTAIIVPIDMLLGFMSARGLLAGGLMRKTFLLLFEGLKIAARGIIPLLKLVSKAFSFLRVGEFIAGFAPLLFFFQILSRAHGIAKLADVENLIAMTPRIAAVMLKLKEGVALLMTPFTIAIDYFGKLLAPLFETSTWLKIGLPLVEVFASALEFLGTTVYLATAGFSGLSMMIIGFIDDILNLRNPLTNALKNMNFGIDDFMKSHPFNADPAKATVNQVTNVGKIEARFDMREQLEPDRIAFAVTTHLKKLAINPTQGRGQSLSSAFGNTQIAGDRS